MQPTVVDIQLIKPIPGVIPFRKAQGTLHIGPTGTGLLELKGLGVDVHVDGIHVDLFLSKIFSVQNAVGNPDEVVR